MKIFIQLIIYFFCVNLSIANVNKVKNVLFIAVDDLKPTLGCYGDKLAKTPNIDALSKQGIIFLNNHCQQAVCGPSRASLMTGKRPDYTQVLDLKTQIRKKNPDIITIPQYFREAGFQTIGMGKIFDPRSVDSKNDALSWSVPFKRFHQIPISKGCKPTVIGHFQSKYAHHLLDEAKQKGITTYIDQKNYLHERGGNQVVEAADVIDAAYEDGRLSEYAQVKLEELRKSDKPFFLAIGFKRPHLPFTAPKKYWDLYDRNDFKIHSFQQKADNGVDIAYPRVGELKSYNGIPDYDNHSEDRSKHLSEDLQLELIHGYYACVSYIDKLVGDLVDKLRKLRLDKDTVIIIWGDHGWHLGDHGLWCKHTNFEQATRSPLLIISPNHRGGIKSSSPVEFIDIFPTLCDITGLSIPSYLDGVSLTPIMEDKNFLIKSSAMSQYPSGEYMGYSIRNKRYRYTEWIKGSTKDKYSDVRVVSRQMFDYKKDPLETVNIVDHNQYQDIVKLMNQELRTYFK